MYLNFYQLRKKPFSLAPDPEFLYLSQQHKDALGAIIYGIKEREGFVTVVGEVGTGKTTVIRSYLNSVYRKQILPVFIFNSKITFHELMQAFLSEIGIASEEILRARTVNEMVRLAYQAMLEKTSHGKNIVLIIDEAQNMPIETLGNLCILSNFETAKAKLIQIVLVGQPELQEKLDLYELRQLRQRVAYRAQIGPLAAEEAVGYLHHRLALATKGKKPIFTTRAVNRILKYSKGVPRVINILCENSLVAGYGLQKKPVSLKVVKQVVAEYEGRRFSGPFQFKNVAGCMLILMLAVLMVISYLPTFHVPEESMGGQVRFKPPSSAPLQPVVSNDKALSSDKKAVKQIEANIARNEQTTMANTESTTFSTEALQRQLMEQITLAHSQELLREPIEASIEGSIEREKSLQEMAESIIALLEHYMSPSKQSPHAKTVQKGDTVSKLCLETYGFYSTRALEWIKSNNPHISNIDNIHVDEVIFFPEMEAPDLQHLPNNANGRSSLRKEEVVSK